MFYRSKQLFVLICLILTCSQVQAKQYKLLILGDSLSAGYNMKQEQGWVSLLQNAWQNEDIEIVNAAISGDTTDGGLARLPRLLELHQPTHLLIELGGNDALQGHPIKKMKNNLQRMIEAAQQQGVKPLLAQTKIPTNFGRRYGNMFFDAYGQLAEEFSVPIISFYFAEIALEPKLMQRDDIHPNADAQPMIAELMQQQLQQHINF